MNETNHTPTARREGRTMLPAVDILENENEVLLLADMPGVGKDAILIHMENDVLRIEGEIQLSMPEHAKPLLNELPARRYARSFTLGRELDAEKIRADIRDGVLRLHIPKSDASKPRRIEVSVS